MKTERKMKKSTILLAAAIAFLALEPNLAFATSSTGDIFQTLQNKGAQTFTNVRNISFIVGAFGLIAIGVMAYFGRFNWKHFAALIGGLVIISGASAAIKYITGQDNSSGSSTQPTLPGITDTFNGQ
jgi:type IV secretory pathway VirB2 component (pilin)